MNFGGDCRDQFWCGDCLKLMGQIPSESMDLILTDPPYGIEYRSNRRVKSEKMPKMVNDRRLQWFGKFVREAHRVLKPDRHFYCFTRSDMYPIIFKEVTEKFRVRNCLIWIKGNHGSGDLRGDYSPQYEMILFGTKGRRDLRGPRASNILEFEVVSGALRRHPCEKPIELLRFLIEKSTLPGEIVLDPFAGVGSVGVACKGGEIVGADFAMREFLMIEWEIGYYMIGMRRLAAIANLAKW